MDYDLPNETAYAETCAAIALVFFACRLLQAEPDAGYADVMEQALYNNILSGVSADGLRFFYDNVLASFPAAGRFNRRTPPERQPWFGCACCPPNLARLFGSLGAYVFSTGADAVFVHLYAAASATLDTEAGRVGIDVQTDYPWDGRVRMRLHPEHPATFTLALRLPGWCRAPALRVNDTRVDLTRVTRRGYAGLRRRWRDGDRVSLDLPMVPERVEAHPAVRQDAGCVALRRGPVLYALESVDNGPDLAALSLPDPARLRVRRDPKILGGVPLLTARGRRRSAEGWDGALYRTTPAVERPATLTAIPYFLWANRGEGEMRVWVRRS